MGEIPATRAFEIGTVASILGIMTKQIPEGSDEQMYGMFLTTIAACLIKRDAELAALGKHPRVILETVAKVAEVVWVSPEHLPEKEDGSIDGVSVSALVVDEAIKILNQGRKVTQWKAPTSFSTN